MNAFSMVVRVVLTIAEVGCGGLILTEALDRDRGYRDWFAATFTAAGAAAMLWATWTI